MAGWPQVLPEVGAGKAGALTAPGQATQESTPRRMGVAVSPSVRGVPAVLTLKAMPATVEALAPARTFLVAPPRRGRPVAANMALAALPTARSERTAAGVTGAAIVEGEMEQGLQRVLVTVHRPVAVPPAQGQDGYRIAGGATGGEAEVRALHLLPCGRATAPAAVKP